MGAPGRADPDDAALTPTLSASPTTTPLRAGLAFGAALLVGAATSGCQQPGEAPLDAGVIARDDVGVDAARVSCDCGEAPSDTDYHPPDVGTDASIPGELPVAIDAAVDANDHPDAPPSDGSATDV